MKTIKISGKKLHVSAPQERSLRLLRSRGFVTQRSEFWEGSRRHLTLALEIDAQFGVEELSREFSGNSKRVDRWFSKNPRCRLAIVGNPRRINSILRQIDGEGSDDPH